jgi:hypothetical protein
VPYRFLSPIGSIFSEPRDATSLLRPTAFEAAYYCVIANERRGDGYETHLDYKKAWYRWRHCSQRRRLQTTLMVSEQGVFLDGYDDAGSRE